MCLGLQLARDFKVCGGVSESVNVSPLLIIIIFLPK